MSKELVNLTQQLHNSGSLKVWSLIISFFGDSIVDRGGNIAAGTVQTVLDRLDVSDGAVRTAFSRLANDGWIDREKLGRRSFYQLTQEGKTPFSLAAKQIYSPVIKPQLSGDTWLLGVHQDKTVLDTTAFSNLIELQNRSVLILNPLSSDEVRLHKKGFLCVTGQCKEVPEWVVNQLRPADWPDQVASLQKAFAKLSRKPPQEPLAALASRTLLIHQWRRVLLRYASLPAALKGQSLVLENECRHFVGDLYHKLTTPAESWLDEHGQSRKGSLPAAKINPASRFTAQYLKLNTL